MGRERDPGHVSDPELRSSQRDGILEIFWFKLFHFPDEETQAGKGNYLHKAT